MMRFSVVLQTRLAVSALGLMLVAVTSLGAQDPEDGAAKLAMAESVIAREEAASERAFDPSFRAKAKELLAALPLAELEAQTGRNGLGLNSLGDSQADLVYTPVTPCRIIDTRLAGGSISAGFARSFKVTGDTTFQGGANCGLPFGPATAAVINLVAVDATGRGNLSITPFGSSMPLASIINFTTGFNIANGPAVVICDPSGTTCSNDITIQANVSATHLVADVQGYFRRVATGGVSTALLADGAVTAPKIGSGVVVRTLNSLTDAVTLAAGSNVSITPSGNTLTVSATPSGGGGDITAVNTPLTGGLQGGVTSGDANLGLVTCGATQLLKSNGTTWGCASDSDSGVNAVIGGQGITGSIAARTLTLGSTATAANTAGAIVGRDASGSFSAGTVALAGNLTLPNTTSASVGMIRLGGTSFLHNFGSGNTFVGASAGNITMAGHDNSAFGASALEANATGSDNSAFGYRTLNQLSSGGSNIAVGYQALSQLSSGNTNIAIGTNAGANLTSGSYNIYIGDIPGNSESGTIRIGSGFTTESTYVAGIYARAAASGTAVYVSPDGKLGVTTSSRRYKEQIAEMDAESDVLLKLRPVSFYYRPELDETHLRQYGLVAEEVAEVAPGLVAYDKDGVPQMVRYHFVNAMLLNEVQKQRRLVEEERRENEDQRTTIARLEARLAKLEAARGDQ